MSTGYARARPGHVQPQPICSPLLESKPILQNITLDSCALVDGWSNCPPNWYFHIGQQHRYLCHASRVIHTLSGLLHCMSQQSLGKRTTSEPTVIYSSFFLLCPFTKKITHVPNTPTIHRESTNSQHVNPLSCALFLFVTFPSRYLGNTSPSDGGLWTYSQRIKAIFIWCRCFPWQEVRVFNIKQAYTYF